MEKKQRWRVIRRASLGLVGIVGATWKWVKPVIDGIGRLLDVEELHERISALGSTAAAPAETLPAKPLDAVQEPEVSLTAGDIIPWVGIALLACVVVLLVADLRARTRRRPAVRWFRRHVIRRRIVALVLDGLALRAEFIELSRRQVPQGHVHLNDQALRGLEAQRADWEQCVQKYCERAPVFKEAFDRVGGNALFVYQPVHVGERNEREANNAESISRMVLRLTIALRSLGPQAPDTEASQP